MDIINGVIDTATTLAGVGVVCWLIAGAIIKGVPQASSGWKFWAAEFVIMLSAAGLYALRLKYLHMGSYSQAEMGVYMAVGYTVSQNLHQGSQYVVERVRRMLEAMFGGGPPVLASMATVMPAQLIPTHPLAPEPLHETGYIQPPPVKDRIDLSNWDVPQGVVTGAPTVAAEPVAPAESA